MVPHTLAKMSGMVAFMMPQRLAEADPSKPITEPIGSGPYKYSRFWSVPWDNKVAYVKNRERVEKRLVDNAPFAVLGQFFEPVAFSTKAQGITSPIQFCWQLHVK
jgi:hypothetical protein